MDRISEEGSIIEDSSVS